MKNNPVEKVWIEDTISLGRCNAILFHIINL